jgi:pyrophosphatase PpaX
MPRPLAILLDLDGTLVDTIGLLMGAMRHAFRGRPGPAPTDGEWRAGIGTPLAAQLAPFAASPAEVDALVAGYRAHQGEHLDRLTTLYPGTRAALDVLAARGHPLAVVTSKSETMTRRTLDAVGLAAAVPVVVSADSTTRHKPHPEPVHLALARLGYAPAEALFVGDSPHDLHAGAAAGVTTVAALWGFFERDVLAAAGAHHFLADIGELPSLVQRLASA